ncbi:hypothetical protein GCM10022261_11350 [Brevibacterium daeguense]|uniref:OCRE domain-containing protein n=1 Tax=Brevibacterium daeguense TaxID=909936 RepID=A0ABP8EI29_9MICO|nr:hypothetical protein [Brevibacterium daeguense]
MNPSSPHGDVPGQERNRPRIKPAQSDSWGSVAADRADAAQQQRTEAQHWTGTQHQAGTQHWTGPDGVEYCRTADGAEYWRAGDGRFYPLSSAQPEPAPVEQSTYYDYIAAHTGEFQRTGAATPVGEESRADVGRRRGRRTVGVVLGSLAAVAVVAGAVVLGGQAFGPDQGIRATELPASKTAEAPVESEPAQDSSTAAGTVDPGAVLQARAEQDTAKAMEDLEGAWVVQLSAKQEGLKTEGRTWTEADILAEFEQNSSEHPDALLLWSGDWSTFQFDDYWVTVLDQAYDTPDDALAQCREMGIDRDHCFAKKLSTTDGPEESTKLNP